MRGVPGWRKGGLDETVWPFENLRFYSPPSSALQFSQMTVVAFPVSHFPAHWPHRWPYITTTRMLGDVLRWQHTPEQPPSPSSNVSPESLIKAVIGCWRWGQNISVRSSERGSGNLQVILCGRTCIYRWAQGAEGGGGGDIGSREIVSNHKLWNVLQESLT